LVRCLRRPWSIPLALLYNVFLNRFIAGFTGGGFR